MSKSASEDPLRTPAAYRTASAAPAAPAEQTGQSRPGQAQPGQARPATAENGKHRTLDYPPAPEPLPAPVIDNHTHLDFKDGWVEVTPEQAMEAAAAVGVQGAVQVGFDVESSRFTREVVSRESRLLGAVAIHPNDAATLASGDVTAPGGEGEQARRSGLDAAIAEIDEIAAHPRIRAIGETGLDYFRTGPDGVADQQYSFRQHIRLAKKHGIALQIHDRDAHDDVVRILREEGAPEKTVFHCYSGGPQLAAVCNEQGWYMSFSGTVTFKNSQPQQQSLLAADPALVLVETDAPFLTPHPYRGRPNASYMIPYTMRFMANLTGTDLSALCSRILGNTVAVYGSWDA